MIPDWCEALRKQNIRPQERAKILDVPFSIVSAAYSGDEQAFNELLDGTASRSKKKLYNPLLSGPFVEIKKNRYPQWMSKNSHEAIVNDLK